MQGCASGKGFVQEKALCKQLHLPPPFPYSLPCSGSQAAHVFITIPDNKILTDLVKKSAFTVIHHLFLPLRRTFSTQYSLSAGASPAAFSSFWETAKCARPEKLPKAITGKETLSRSSFQRGSLQTQRFQMEKERQNHPTTSLRFYGSLSL